MSRLYVFADESGDFVFADGHNISRYFSVCTVSMESCDVSHDLLKLRRALAWENRELGDHFHATNDKQDVRDLVFETITRHNFHIQATIMEKRKAPPQTRTSDIQFYKTGWYNHFFHGMQGIIRPYPELHVTAASIGVKREWPAFKGVISHIMRQTIQGKVWSTDVFPACTDPCLQVADYCAWAIQKKWVRDDTRSYDLIKNRITHENDLWAKSTEYYY